jgi:hypothetical protein
VSPEQNWRPIPNGSRVLDQRQQAERLPYNGSGERLFAPFAFNDMRLLAAGPRRPALARDPGPGDKSKI